MQPTSIRSTISPIDEEMLGLDELERREIKAQELEDRKKLNQIKSLAEHPGWITIKNDVLEKRITDYKSGKVLIQASLDSHTTDEQLGKLTRVSLLVAEELETIVNLIENAGSDD